VEAGNCSSIETMAHSVKGASLAIGASILGACSRQMEMAAQRGDLDEVRELLGSLRTESRRFDEAIREALGLG
jgi:HPt (histidine-containing phosphotransfer) domain-containing protein